MTLSNKQKATLFAMTMILTSVIALTTFNSSVFAQPPDKIQKEPVPEIDNENSDTKSLVDALVRMELENRGVIKKAVEDGPPRFLPDDPRHPNNRVNGKVIWDKPEGQNDPVPALGTTHRHYGTLLNKDTANTKGVYGKNQVSTTVSLNNGEWLYAPTNMSPSNSPLEIVTVYNGVSGSTTKQVRVYDHTTGNWVAGASRTINSTFLSTYTLNIGGNNYYYAEVYKSGTTWYAKIYNFTAGAWETLATSTGSGSIVDGWGFWEEYYLDGNCPTLPAIRERGIQVLNNGVWKDATSTYASLYNTGLPCTYSGSFIVNYSEWVVQ